MVQNPSFLQEQLDPFAFDHAFGQESGQGSIYDRVVEPVVNGVLSGINGTVFCYGQTGSGKTYTMEGTDEDPGLLPRLGASVFGSIHDGIEQVSVCFVEIYMEKLHDLLVPSNKVEVRETMSGSVYLANACERIVFSSAEMLSCIKAGQKNRSVATTRMNERSSRSHSVFSMSVKTRDVTTGIHFQGVLHFVDLAGSESQGRTGAAGQILEQSRHINQSLLGLGRVITALGAGQPHVPYRDSKLTRILQDSLGGNARTSLIVNISPESINAHETISSLRFGQGASLVKNAPKVNVVDHSVSDLRKMLSERDEEIANLRARIVVLEGSPCPAADTGSTPQKATEWMEINTPKQANKSKPTLLKLEELAVNSEPMKGNSRQVLSQRRRSWLEWLRFLVVCALVANYAYSTNPGKQNDEGFRRFLQGRYTSVFLHRLLESFGFLCIDVWDMGLASLGQESSRVFIGVFDQWIELGNIPSLQLSESHDLDALVFVFIGFYVMHLLWPITMQRHSVLSISNLSSGRLWSTILSQISHARLEHVIMNSLLLYSVGPQAHASLGRNRFFVLFLIGGGCVAFSSIIFRCLLKKRCDVETHRGGSCGALFALLGYVLAAGHINAHAVWLGSEWGWAEFILLQMILNMVTGLDIIVYFMGVAVGWVAGEWKLLEFVPAG